MAPTISGHSVFRNALLVESALNLCSMTPMVLAPETILEYVARDTSEVTPLSASLLQWIGGLLTLATAPLLLSHAEPTNASDSMERAAVAARRRLTYAIMCISELALAATTTWQLFRGNSGIKDAVLLTASASIGGFGLLRGWLLFAKPHWMESPLNERKRR